MRISTLLPLLLVTTAVACGGSSSSPTQTPTPTPTQEVVAATFSDPASSFSTADVRDVQDQIMRFDTASSSLVWMTTGQRFAGYPVIDGLFIRADKFFRVRFGTKNGERRAYFTEAVRGTLCDVEVSNGVVNITPTDVLVPGT
jgi:hypothetical protein